MSRLDAYERLKCRLMSGDLEPGQFITQREFAELAGVPLGAAREAIMQLEHEQLLRVYPQRGIQIADCTIKALNDAFNYRKILERYAIEHYVEHANQQSILNLAEDTRRVLDALKSCGFNQDLQEQAVEIDWRLHDEIIASLRNDVVTRDYQINAGRIRLMRVSNRLDSDRIVEALNEHLEILNAALDRDKKRAAAALESHLATAMNRALNGN